MTRHRRYIMLISMFVIGVSAVMTPLVGTSYALTAEEMLADPALENRARTLSKQLRCLCLLYTSPSPRDRSLSRMPSSA